MSSLTPGGYRPRLIDTQIEEYLRAFGGLVVEGAKWCGKTWTGLHHAASVVYLDDANTRERAELQPRDVLTGTKPLLVDEWQEVPKVFDAARRLIDDTPGKGHFILTGSAVPPLKATSHSGIGRFARLRMRPMSLFESGDSTGKVSLADLLTGRRIEPFAAGLSYQEVVRLLCRGGWPGSLGQPDDVAFKLPGEYLAAVAESDISRTDGVARNPKKVRQVLISLARNTATLASVGTIHTDVAGQDGLVESVSLESVRVYLDALDRIFATEDLPSWRYELRSKSQLLASPKRHFVDPSLAVAALGASPADLEADPKTTGFLFESLCARDLRVYAQANHGEVFHYRDKKNLEADAIVSSKGGKWGAVEVKLDWKRADEAAHSLLRLKKKLQGQIADPSFLMVLTATGAVAHTRDDGVHVVPIDCLGP
ncbi:MAG: DUF4143 domain-containing protein [Micrococcales bacterium]|nr:DUF4143 domain-containing protein [Micrococcales bacterium]